MGGRSDVEASYRYGRGGPALVARFSLGAIFLGLLAASGFFLAVTNTRGLILNGFPLSPVQASVAYGAGGILAAVLLLVLIVQTYREATDRREIAFLRDGILIPRESGTGDTLVPFSEIRRWEVSEGRGRGSYAPLLGPDDPEAAAQIRIATDLAEFRILRHKLRRSDCDEILGRLESRSPRSRPAAPSEKVPSGRAYQVLGCPAEAPGEPRVVARFDDAGKANEFARFIKEAGTYSDIQIREAQAGPVPAPDPGPAGRVAGSRDHLGKVLLERRPSLIVRSIVMLFLVPVGLIFTLGGLINSYWKFRQIAQGTGLESPWWLPFLLLGAGGAFLLGAGHGLSLTFRCHRRGVSQQGLFGTRRLRYEEIDEVVPQGVQVLLFGIIPFPFSTRVRLAFVPRQGSGLRPIVFMSDAFRDPDPDALYGEIMRIVDRNTPEE